MREQRRTTVPLDEALDATLRDLMARQAPSTLKARVMARLDAGVVDAALRDIAAHEVPSTLRARVMARLDEEPIGAGTRREGRWVLARPLLRPAAGFAAVGLLAAIGLTAWLVRSSGAPTQGRVPQVAAEAHGRSGASKGGPAAPERTATLARDLSVSPAAEARSRPGPTRASTRAARPATRPAEETGEEPAAPVVDPNDPLAIRPLRIDPLAVPTITIRPIEIAPLEIAPPMSDATSGPPVGDSESRLPVQGQ
jgi:hypothetical protein